MWELYDDDQSFQRMAQGRGKHDAMFLAQVLYGKQENKTRNEPPKDNLKNEIELKKTGGHVQFRCEEGKFRIDPALLEQREEEESEYMSRAKDYTFQPVKSCLDFVKNEQCSGVQTDVLIFDRNASSEFDTEREELKDDLVAWNIRYQERLNKCINCLRGFQIKQEPARV
eukprot:GFUD01094379.1.p1 GENE.GFUD01094379.1~~GFUD01094379.1.p1  ORF type:complete len:170 (+),score=47.89 GFUD01094379.1:28-537(+)